MHFFQPDVYMLTLRENWRARTNWDSKAYFLRPYSPKIDRQTDKRKRKSAWSPVQITFVEHIIHSIFNTNPKLL